MMIQRVNLLKPQRTAETPETPDTPPLTAQTIEEDLLQALGEKKSKNELELLFWSGVPNQQEFCRRLKKPLELICRAAERGSEAIIKMAVHFLDQYIDDRNEHGKTPLGIALENGHMKIAQLLYPDSQRIKGDSDLLRQFQRAVRHDREDVVLFLFATHSHLIEKLLDIADINGSQAIHHSAELGSNRVLKVLIDQHYEPNRIPLTMQNSSGDSPLHLAVRGGT